MEYTGLARKYPINRPLTEGERERQLRQGKRLEVDPAYQLSVIRMNSTYVELVDKFFEWKGFLTAVVLATLPLIAGMTHTLLVVHPPGESGGALEDVFFFALVVVPFACGAAWVLFKDAFTYTHYPIRLNRKTRMVYVFRIDGTVLSVPWDEVFFCIGSLPQYNWEIQGHVLDADGKTVRETFAFPQIAAGRSESELLKHYWEFVRRYMEDENLAPIHAHAQYVLPISDKRESFRMGWERRRYLVGSVPFPLQWLMLAIYVITYPGRWIAMRTSMLPKWPEEIEATCRVEAGDPFVRDARDNPVGLR